MKDQIPIFLAKILKKFFQQQSGAFRDDVRFLPRAPRSVPL
jgi:hypothetical protein